MLVWKPLPRVLGISPGEHRVRRDVEFLALGAARGGLRVLVLREPRLDATDYVALARRLAPAFGEGLVLHASHPAAAEVAARAGWGLHLPAAALAEGERLRPRVRGLLGVSCHSPIEVAAAHQLGADYAFYSPVFKPLSKAGDRRRTLGLRRLEEVARSAQLPVVALGGITPRRARRCIEAGAAAVAAVHALWGEDHTPEEAEAAARELVAAAGGGA